MEITVAQTTPAQETIAMLTARAQQGDDDAFTRLHEHFESGIYHFLYTQCLRAHFLHPDELARDFTQDVFLKAWLSIGQTAPDLRLQGWLYRMATNRFIDYARHARVLSIDTWDAHFNEAHEPREATGNRVRDTWAVKYTAPRSDQPDTAALDAELRAQVRQVLNTLPPRYRMTLTLREFYDWSYDEIARGMGTTRAAVKSLLFRARQLFAEQWAQLVPDGAQP